MCVLRVTGKKFEPASFLASSKLTPYSVFRAGEPRFTSKPSGRIHGASGFKIDVSRRPWNSLAGQVVDAIAFLKKHKAALARLRSIPEVEDVRLDFPLAVRIDRESVVVQFDYFPPELASLAGALGIGLEISIYARDSERAAPRGRDSSRAKRSRESKKQEP